MKRVSIPPGIEAWIFDTDGVITDTASVHAAAWKRAFDSFLEERSEELGEPFRPFTDEDYRRYVDGKPRYDGVKSFLESRGITLPFGEPEDPPESETICGMGNRKNQDFLSRLSEGVEPYRSTLELIRRLLNEGIRTAVISASENAAEVLEASGVEDLFDVKVDGRDAARLGLAGKPDPAVFLEAARRLGVDPERAAVVEDAIAGVEAARRGGFRWVIGVDRSGNPEPLRRGGADVVVGDLEELEVSTGSVASALSAWDEIAERLGGARVALFCDYDGTLTPIVARPEDALLPSDTRRVLERLAGVCPVAIISGRDLADVRDKVGLEGIVYAGSHGFDIAAPPDRELEGGPAFDEILPVLDQTEAELDGELAGVAGARVDRKRFSIALHFRQVADEDVAVVEAAADRAAARHPELRKSGGRKVFELRPDVRWDKGAALLWLVEGLGLDGADWVPVYLGDDTTDEDAFRAIRERGVGIIVGAPAQPTSAHYALDDPGEVRVFLERLFDLVRA